MTYSPFCPLAAAERLSTDSAFAATVSVLPVDNASAPDCSVPHTRTSTTVAFEDELATTSCWVVPVCVSGSTNDCSSAPTSQNVADRPRRSPFVAQDATDAEAPTPAADSNSCVSNSSDVRSTSAEAAMTFAVSVGSRSLSCVVSPEPPNAPN